MSTKTILFADDSATMRHIVEKTFAAEPYDVVCVPSGEGAVAKAKEIRPNVIIVDAGMPGVSGYDVCKAVREDPTLSRTPVVIMSGVSNLYDETRGREAGVTEHMKKPFDTGHFIEMVTGLAAAAPVVEDVPLEEVTEPEEDILLPVSEAPAEALEPVDASKAPEPIPLVSDDAPSYHMSSLTSLDAPLDLEPVDEEEQAADIALPSSFEAEEHEEQTAEFETAPPADEPEAEEQADELIPVSDESYGEADFGVEEPLAPEAPSTDSDVSPIEIKPRDEADDSGSFHVGTLAELAQMDSAGRTLETDSHEDAIEISPSAGSLASLGPQLPEAESDAAPATDAGALSSVADYEERQEASDNLSETLADEEPSPAAEAAPSMPEVASSMPRTTEAVRELADDAAAEIAANVEGITATQAAAIQTLTREIIERVVWEVVPDLAEVIIKEELSKLLEE